MPILNQMHSGNKKVLYQDDSIRIIEDLRNIEEINEEHNKNGKKNRYKNNIIIEKFYGKDELGVPRWMEIGVPRACNEIIESYTDMIDALVYCCKQKDDELKESAA